MEKLGLEVTKDDLYQFHEMIYYMVITVTTVGYGDISPQSELG